MKTNTDESTLELATETLRAIAHPIRISIIQLLHTHKQLTVTELFTLLDIEQAIASHHLRIMKNLDVVRVRREGKHSVYMLEKPEFYEVIRLLLQAL
jgi:DNA-binding transcriptional ArsR family regulator